MPISPVSLASLLLQPKVNGHALGTATGFIFKQLNQNYLVTNWHVLSGRDRETGQPMANSGATPDTVDIRYLRRDVLPGLTWFDVSEPLEDEAGRPLWLEHPRFGRRVDVVALPLTSTAPIAFFPYDPSFLKPSMRAVVSDWINIVGFPFGLSGGGSDGSSYAVWTKGAVATEMDVNFDGLPCFLIDSRSRKGQSGSPVVSYAPSGTIIDEEGKTVFLGEPRTNLLGVYSGRINSESDLGHVWKATTILDVVRGRTRGSNTLKPPTPAQG